MRKKPFPRPKSILLLASLLLLAGVAAAGTLRFEAKPDEAPHQKAQDGAWEVTPLSHQDQEYCTENAPGTLCAEWCEGLEGTPTGYVCCVPDEYIGFPGRQSDCLLSR